MEKCWWNDTQKYASLCHEIVVARARRANRFAIIIHAKGRNERQTLIGQTMAINSENRRSMVEHVKSIYQNANTALKPCIGTSQRQCVDVKWSKNFSCIYQLMNCEQYIYLLMNMSFYVLFLLSLEHFCCCCWVCRGTSVGTAAMKMKSALKIDVHVHRFKCRRDFSNNNIELIKADDFINDRNGRATISYRHMWKF